MHHNSHRQSSTTVSTLPLRRQFNEVTNASGPRTPILPRVLGSVSTNSSPQQILITLHVTESRCQNNRGKGKPLPCAMMRWQYGTRTTYSPASFFCWSPCSESLWTGILRLINGACADPFHEMSGNYSSHHGLKKGTRM